MSDLQTRRITIPTVGTVLTLTEAWAFSLFHETRNSRFLEKLGIERSGREYGANLNHNDVVLPRGTKLVVDRVYVRQGAEAFDSITFRLRKGEHGVDKKIFGRFWAKLGDVNRIYCTWAEDTVKRDTKISPLTQLASEGE